MPLLQGADNQVTATAAGQGRNPATGAAIDIPPEKPAVQGLQPAGRGKSSRKRLKDEFHGDQKDLTDRLVDTLGLTGKESKALVESFFDIFCSTLAACSLQGRRGREAVGLR
ncbi:hypothetical protein [Acidithiobacillus ferruginosus]|uniref:hypothetical protein n=1 Tax=Acidithiobacillus ferruginosus TaxID=3063951 RepID=UPI001C06CC5B|nr:hypothetical protein [Acidithiobacillus ferruginosus]